MGPAAPPAVMFAQRRPSGGTEASAQRPPRPGEGHRGRPGLHLPSGAAGRFQGRGKRHQVPEQPRWRGTEPSRVSGRTGPGVGSRSLASSRTRPAGGAEGRNAMSAVPPPVPADSWPRRRGCAASEPHIGAAAEQQAGSGPEGRKSRREAIPLRHPLSPGPRQ